MNTTFIYGLIDPHDHRLRYIGKADDPKGRLRRHMRELDNTRRGNWLSGLKAQGLKPDIQIIQEVSKDDWQVREQFWIKSYRATKHDLVNGDEGGQGGTGRKHTEASRRKMSEAHKRIVFTDEWLRNMSKAQLGRKHSPETRQKISASNKGQRPSPQAIAATVVRCKGKPLSEELKRKLSLAGKGRLVTEETRQKISRKNKGRIVSAESRTKMSVAHKGKRLSAEHRAKLSAT